MSQDKLKPKPVDPEIVRAEPAHPDDVIHVPKGSHKVRFLMTFLIVVLVLTTFTVTGPLMDALSGRDTSFQTYMSWSASGGEERSLSQKKFQENKNAYLLVNGMLSGRAGRDVSDEEVAAFIVLDDAAERAGIRTPDSEVAEVIKSRYPSKAVFQDDLRRNRTSNKEVETMLRRMLRVNRYGQLQTLAQAVPDPAAVESAWKGRHQEYAFDYVEQPVAGMVDEARAMAPKGEELKTWFDALSEQKKEIYKTKPKVSAELVALLLEGPWSGEAILAKYPLPPEVDAEQEAVAYAGGGGFGYIRFPKTPTSRGDTNFKPFEEVKDEALREAPVYNALMQWAAELQKRETDGQPVDLAAEAAALGLSYRKQSDTRNRDEWKEMGIPYVGRITIDRLFEQGAEAGKLLLAIQVDEKAFVYGRILEIEPARMPEFSEIEERVATAWADEKARELAVAKLEEIRNSFGTPPDPNDPAAPPFVPEADEARFREVVQAAGLTVQRRDWQERSAPPQPDESQGDLYLRSNPMLYTQKVNTVVKPALNRDGTVAYLVRVGGVRDPALSKMNPAELEQLVQMQARDAHMQLMNSMYTRPFLQAHYGLDLASWHVQDEPPTD